MQISKKRPIIFSLLDSPSYGGAEQFLLNTLVGLSQDDFPVYLATNNTRVKSIFIETIEAHKLHQFGIVDFPFVLDAIGNWKGLVKFFFFSPFALMWLIRIIMKIKKENSHIVCLWAGFSDRLLFTPIAHILNVKIIWIEFGPLEPVFQRNWGFPRVLYHFSKQFPQAIITISQNTLKSLKKAGHIDHPVHLIYPGVETFTPQQLLKFQQSGKKWLSEKKIHNQYIFCLVGRIEKETEIDVFLDALQYFHDNFTNDFLALIIGDGSEKEHLTKKMIRLSLEENVIFTGFLNDFTKKSLVSVSSLCVFSRAWELEGFGMSSAEALALGVPVIAANFGPQKELVLPDKTGELFQPHNSQDLALKMYKAIKDKSKLIQMGINGKQRIAKYFSLSQMIESIRKVILQTENES